MDCPYRQCRGEWKLARVASALVTYMGGISKGDRPRFRNACVAGDLPVAPTATRWNVAVISNVSSIVVHTAARWGIDVIFNASSWIVHTATPWILR